MPILKDDPGVTILASQSLAAGGTVTSPSFDHRERYGAAVIGKITNGGTGPNTPPEFIVEASIDNFASNVDEIFRAGAKTAAGAVTPLLARVPPEIKWFRVKFVNTDGQAVTVACVAHVVKALG